MLRIGNLNVEVDDYDPQHKVLRGIYGIASEPSKDAPGRIARLFLRRVAPSLGLKPDLADLKFDPVKHSILGSHVLCQQKIWGQPATDAWVKVSIDKQGRVFHVVNTCHPPTVPAHPAKRILAGVYCETREQVCKVLISRRFAARRCITYFGVLQS